MIYYQDLGNLVCQKLDSEKRDCRRNDEDYIDEALCESIGCCWEYENDPTIAPSCFCIVIYYSMLFDNQKRRVR